MADRAREDFARCVSRKLGESQSKDAKNDDLQAVGTQNVGVELSYTVGCFHLFFRFGGSCLIVRPRNPRQACLPLSVDGLSFRSGRCRPEHVCWDCCLYHFGRERFFCAVSFKTHYKRHNL